MGDTIIFRIPFPKNLGQQVIIPATFNLIFRNALLFNKFSNALIMILSLNSRVD